MIRTALLTILAAAALAAAGGAWLAGADTALAPEPAMLTAPLYGPNGTAASGYVVNTGVAATVVKWSSSWLYNPSLPAGTPCSANDLDAWRETPSVVQAIGNYRRCG